MNDFPRMGIVTADLIAAVEELIEQAAAEHEAGLNTFGAVNWADLGVADVEYRLSMMERDAQPWCVVTVEEASPHSGLAPWINQRLDKERFPNCHVECEW